MRGKLFTLFIICTMTVSLSACGARPSGGTGTTPSNKTESSSSEPTATTEHYEADLSAGHYTAGKDIPVGTYNLTATSGGGNVSSSNMFSGGLNEVMGSPADELHSDSFTGLQMEEGTVLSITSTVVIHAVSEDANTAGVTPRAASDASPIELGAGNYVSGTDFPAGYYNVVSVEGAGSGNVTSDNMFDGGLNEIIGSSDASGLGIAQFNNASFPEGTTLSISGTTVQLVPVGE